MLQYWGIRLCTFALRRIPLGASYGFARVIADITFLLWRRGRANMLDNMSHVLGANATQREVREMAKRSLRNYAKCMVDYLRLSFMTAEELAGRIECHYWDRVESLKNEGKGVVLVGMHMGSWDLGPALLSQRHPVSVIVESFPYSRMNDFVQGIRTRVGMNAIPMERAARRILNALRNNHFLGILIDRPVQENGVPVSFFNATTYVPAGAATLSLRTGAPVATFAIIRNKDDNFLTLFDDAITVERSGNFENDVQRLTQTIMDSLENMIRSYPDQWYMFRPMWQAQEQYLMVAENISAT
ncbi:MAG: hypothetical protein EXR50_04565 [Dehalococcoidia bacterium]|nr:hypothetical protein [Dehalococcoidia bacterium]